MRIGIDVGGTNLKAGLVDEEGKILTVCRTPVERFADGRDFARTLAELALKAAAQGGVRPGKLEYVGIGIPGINPPMYEKVASETIGSSLLLIQAAIERPAV